MKESKNTNACVLSQKFQVIYL